MNYLRFFLFPFALIYGGIVLLRNWLYDRKIFRPAKFNLPVICIGNLSLGGTGKTPHTEYLIRLLRDRYKLATLSRGFGRKEQTFRIADKDATAENLGDEPLQYYYKFGESIAVAVEANRVLGVMDICSKRPETNLILLDDAFQHRKIEAGLSILLTRYDKPFYEDYILPVGNLREFRHAQKRADIIVVTKCPDFNQINRQHVIEKLKPQKNQHVFFSRIRYGQLQSMAEKGTVDERLSWQIILVTGIADAQPLVKHLSEKNELIHHFEYRDHHRFTAENLAEIHNLFDKFASPQTLLVTTEKDAMRLLGLRKQLNMDSYPWYYQSIEVDIDKAHDFDKLILEYAEKNS